MGSGEREFIILSKALRKVTEEVTFKQIIKGWSNGRRVFPAEDMLIQRPWGRKVCGEFE